MMMMMMRVKTTQYNTSREEQLSKQLHFSRILSLSFASKRQDTHTKDGRCWGYVWNREWTNQAVPPVVGQRITVWPFVQQNARQKKNNATPNKKKIFATTTTMAAASSSSVAAALATKLQQKVGVTPTTDWLHACLEHLQLTNYQDDDDQMEDAVLQQLLYTDLRDVVRPLVASNDNDKDNKSLSSLSSAAASLLRKSLKESCTNDARKVVLDDSFALLVQIEELLDVSQNAESRLAVGPVSPHNPTPVGNQSKRCLKLYLSDGHVHERHLVATESSPISPLSVHSRAGIKVRLRGPLTIRSGVLLLDPANTTVLGGCVPALQQVQQRSIQQAQRLAGIGMDPTVRALVWNPHTGAEQGKHNQKRQENMLRARHMLESMLTILSL